MRHPLEYVEVRVGRTACDPVLSATANQVKTATGDQQSVY